jgi:hypothetical protein
MRFRIAACCLSPERNMLPRCEVEGRQSPPRFAPLLSEPDLRTLKTERNRQAAIGRPPRQRIPIRLGRFPNRDQFALGTL